MWVGIDAMVAWTGPDALPREWDGGKQKGSQVYTITLSDVEAVGTRVVFDSPPAHVSFYGTNEQLAATQQFWRVVPPPSG